MDTLKKTKWVSTFKMWFQNIISKIDNHEKRISGLEKKFEDLEKKVK